MNRMDTTAHLLRRLADLIGRLPPGTERDECIRARAKLDDLKRLAVARPATRNGHAIEPPPVPVVTAWPMARQEMSA
jgi:hypothetical protein